MTELPFLSQLIRSIVLITIYTFCIYGIYNSLDRQSWKRAQAIALSIVTTQACLSVIFQIRFLSGSAIIGTCMLIAFVIYCGYKNAKQRNHIPKDWKDLLELIHSAPTITWPIIACLAYSIIQTFFLPVSNHDAQTYHLPRVLLFIQNNTFFLDSFSNYHEAVFPVGADILFYPFLAWKTEYGLSIFSLSSYCAIGLTAYALAQCYTSQRKSLLIALMTLSINILLLQSVSVKNDIIMAATAAVLLLFCLRLNATSSFQNLLLFLFLIAYGISIKTTFIAFLPGLGLLAIFQLKLWKLSQIKIRSTQLLSHYKLTLAALLPILVASQIWLFTWNIHNYGNLAGPEEFTYMHQQHDGTKGTIANAARYTIEMLQIGFIADSYFTQATKQEPFSHQLLILYETHILPIVGHAGESESFSSFMIIWAEHEDFAWGGISGAFLIFICTPYAILRKPRSAVILLPAILYFIMICATICWMPWNGRFFAAFFACMSPAFAITLESITTRSVYHTLHGITLLSMLITKVTDQSRPLINAAYHYYTDPSPSLYGSLINSTEGSNIWSRSLFGKDRYSGTPSETLKEIPLNSKVGIYMDAHNTHFGFLIKRPDIEWLPLNHIRGAGTVDPKKSYNIFRQSNLEYLLFVHITSLENFEIATSADGYARIIPHPENLNLRNITIEANDAPTKQTQNTTPSAK